MLPPCRVACYAGGAARSRYAPWQDTAFADSGLCAGHCAGSRLLMLPLPLPLALPLPPPCRSPAAHLEHTVQLVRLARGEAQRAVAELWGEVVRSDEQVR